MWTNEYHENERVRSRAQLILQDVLVISAVVESPSCHYEVYVVPFFFLLLKIFVFKRVKRNIRSKSEGKI